MIKAPRGHLSDTMAESPLNSSGTALCSPLEQEVLDEYVQLLGNLNKVLLPLTSSAYLYPYSSWLLY